MHKTYKRNSRRLLAMFLAIVTIFSTLSISASAAQENGYHDPAEHWMTASNRTNELDVNAVLTHETFFCAICQKPTSFSIWRTPEYTRDGVTALSRNIRYSDGTLVGGEGTGRILDGTPGVDAYYTGYHWTKAMCDTCGTMNGNSGLTDYDFGKNVYWLYDCAAEFMEELPENISYDMADSTYHTKTTTGGEYCCFCYGTRHKDASKLERHTLKKTVIPQISNGRFAVVENCEKCDYEKISYVAAKSVVANYYGVVDGQPHTLTLSDLSESGVTTQIRYGSSAENCTLSSTPNYTEEGQYTVYYAITYTYGGESMTENGVAYAWLRDEADENGCTCGCGDPDCDCGGNKNCDGSCHKGGCGDKDGQHSFTLLETVKPTCKTLGYTRYLCVNCGIVEKRDYVNHLDHAWQSIVIREATCEVGGKVLNICKNCGEVQEKTTPKGEHKYSTHTEKATCVTPGYTVKECEVCGDRHITDVTSALPHNYEAHTIPATCENGGKTVHLCEGCGSSFVTDYTDALGHKFDKGTAVTTPSCSSEGVTEYRCERCGYHYLEGESAKGHTPDHEPTCTEPSTCTACGAVLKPATGHKASDWIVDREPTTDNEGARHKECQNCGEVLEKESVEKLYLSATTDTHGEAVVGGYLVIVTDTDTKAPVSGAAVALNKSGSISVRLPDGRIIDYADQTTVQVMLVKDKTPVHDLLIAVTDKNNNYSAGLTDKAGQITVPGTSGKTNSDGNATVGWEDADGNRITITVKVEDYETGRPIEDAAVTIGKTENITVVLPDGTDMDENNRITITVTDNRKNPMEDENIIVKGDLGQKAEGKTDEDGKLTVPAVAVTARHAAYIVGYPDGTFGPERNMTRAEAAAIFGRLLAEKKNDTINPVSHTKFIDVPANAWCSGYVRYLTAHGVTQGCGSNHFCPERAITRAEFVAMAVRFFAAYGDGNTEIMEQYAAFTDVNDGYWAAAYIKDAAINGWIVGYGDGTFRAENSITRAEIVTVMNRLLGWNADKTYIKANLKKLNTFTDMSDKHWAYYAVMEAANTHTAILDGEESWSK